MVTPSIVTWSPTQRQSIDMAKSDSGDGGHAWIMDTEIGDAIDLAKLRVAGHLIRIWADLLDVRQDIRLGDSVSQK